MPSFFFLFLSGWNWCLDNLLETKTWSVNILATQQTYHYSAASKKKKTKNMFNQLIFHWLPSGKMCF